MEAVITRRRCDGCGKVEESAECPVFGGEDFRGWLVLEGGGPRARWRKHFCGAACLLRLSPDEITAPPLDPLTAVQSALMEAVRGTQQGV